MNPTSDNLTTSEDYMQEFLKNLNIDYTDFVAAGNIIHQKIAEAVTRIKDAPFPITDDEAYVGHSGGKDSVLVRFLADAAGKDLIATVHTTKPTGVENAVHPLTQAFLYSLERPVTYVSLKYFTNWVTNEGFKTQIDGTRISEYNREDGRSVDVVINGESVSRKNLPLYLENGLFGLNFVYPIYDWSDAEVWAAIFAYNIPFSSEYLVPGIGDIKAEAK